MMKKDKTLWSLSLDQSAVIKELTTEGSMRERLMELGFLPGATVSCLLQSPLGEPKAYSAGGVVIALRREDAERIIICRGGDARGSDKCGDGQESDR